MSVARCILSLILLVSAAVVQAAAIHHDLAVTLVPDERRLEVVDRIELPADAPRTLAFRLHGGLAPRLQGDGASLTLFERTPGPRRGLPVETWRLALDPGVSQVTLSYGGEIHHSVAELGAAYSRSFSVSPGLIDADGVFLAGSSHWVPWFEGYDALTFELDVSMPSGWRAVSQGQRGERAEQAGSVHESWSEGHPQEEVYLIAAPFAEYRRPGPIADAVVFLREPDQALATRYLDLTGRYLAMYQGLLGDYPYSKFALVENFWETGYGMPSFTLLGPRVIRLPFIPYTSYPHEILHNWWGNGVYVDFESGNWSEGLTSYLADHLLKEQRGSGADYRREALQKYTDYVSDNEDFPLNQFRGRHNAVTQAVGYGKTMMVFHMLRTQLGDDGFAAALRRFYADNRFRVASWTDVAVAFSAVAGESLAAFFEQWVERPGAPALRVRDATVEPLDGGYRLRAMLEQTQDGPVYDLLVPIAIAVEGQAQAMLRLLPMAARELELELELPARPLRLAVDPDFDLFRRLYREEIPPAISQALGAERVLVVLPSAAPKPLLAAYQKLAESWRRGRSARVEIRRDDQLRALPDDRAVWLFGWRNRFRPIFDQSLVGYPFASAADGVTVAGTALKRQDNTAVVLARHPDDPDQALGWIATDNPAAIPGLARKLPHYGKYSFLGFSGDAPDNMAKGQWPSQQSPLSIALDDDVSVPLELPPRAPLVELPPAYSSERMMRDLSWLASPELQGRGLGSAGLEQAGEYIAAAFQAAGLEPAGDEGESFFQVWQTVAGDPAREMTLRNVVGRLPGLDPSLSDRPLIIGAHYDHLGLGWPDVREGNRGQVHLGADDNASGVAVMLELARVLADGKPPERPILFIAFTGEEAGRMGSRHFVEQLDGGAAAAFAMINLDTVGRLGDGPLYVLGASSAEQWGHIARGAGYVAGVEVKAVDEPLDSSDQTSFIDAAIPAVQLFSGAHADYHRPTDSVDEVDAAGLVRVASVTAEAIDYLSSGDARLTPAASPTATGAVGPESAAPPRRAALGTIPDFGFDGEGVRLSGVVPQSPAQAAGLRDGDVLVAINGRPLADLRSYAAILRELAPGDAIQINYMRDGAAYRVDTQVKKR